jgi:hypothetical protein
MHDVKCPRGPVAGHCAGRALLVAVLTLAARQAHAKVAPVEILWVLPADGAEDVPTNTHVWVAYDYGFGAAVSLARADDGRLHAMYVDERPVVVGGIHHISLLDAAPVETLEADTSLQVRAVLGRPGDDPEIVLEQGFRTGNQPDLEPPELGAFDEIAVEADENCYFGGCVDAYDLTFGITPAEDPGQVIYLLFLVDVTSLGGSRVVGFAQSAAEEPFPMAANLETPYLDDVEDPGRPCFVLGAMDLAGNSTAQGPVCVDLDAGGGADGCGCRIGSATARPPVPLAAWLAACLLARAGRASPRPSVRARAPRRYI